jgi:hypothetical protein
VSCWRYTASCSLTKSFIGFSLIDHLDFDSGLDLTMDLNLDEPTSPSSATSAPVATSRHCTLSAPTTQHQALDLSPPPFLRTEGPCADGQVRGHRGRGGDSCALGGGAGGGGADARVKTTASGSSLKVGEAWVGHALWPSPASR